MFQNFIIETHVESKSEEHKNEEQLSTCVTSTDVSHSRYFIQVFRLKKGASFMKP